MVCDSNFNIKCIMKLYLGPLWFQIGPHFIGFFLEIATTHIYLLLCNFGFKRRARHVHIQVGTGLLLGSTAREGISENVAQSELSECEDLCCVSLSLLRTNCHVGPQPPSAQFGPAKILVWFYHFSLLGLLYFTSSMKNNDECQIKAKCISKPSHHGN